MKFSKFHQSRPWKASFKILFLTVSVFLKEILKIFFIQSQRKKIHQYLKNSHRDHWRSRSWPIKAFQSTWRFPLEVFERIFWQIVLWKQSGGWVWLTFFRINNQMEIPAFKLATIVLHFKTTWKYSLGSTIYCTFIATSLKIAPDKISIFPATALWKFLL